MSDFLTVFFINLIVLSLIFLILFVKLKKDNLDTLNFLKRISIFVLLSSLTMAVGFLLLNDIELFVLTILVLIVELIEYNVFSPILILDKIDGIGKRMINSILLISNTLIYLLILLRFIFYWVLFIYIL